MSSDGWRHSVSFVFFFSVVSKNLMDTFYSAAVAGVLKTIHVKTITIETDVTCDPY